jgi:hypothetical protein
MTNVDALHRLADSLRRGIQQKHRTSILERAGYATIRGIESETPVRTGDLRRGNVLTVQSLGDYARIHNLMDYATLVEYGRGPIEAAPGKVLRFEIGGQVLYRKQVKGTRPNPFYRRGAERSSGERARVMREVGGQILTAIGGRR